MRTTCEIFRPSAHLVLSLEILACQNSNAEDWVGSALSFSQGALQNLFDTQRTILGVYFRPLRNFLSALLAIMAGKKAVPGGDGALVLSQPAHCVDAGDVLSQLQSDSQSGLSDGEVSKRQQIYGHNALEGSGGAGPIRILMNQVLNALTMVGWQPINLAPRQYVPG